MTASADVVIAGLGAMGSAAAWQLALRGQRVVGFDRFRPPHGMGSSTGRSRIIREAYWESPFYVPLVRRAYELWAELERRTGRQLLRPTGGLVIGPPGGPLVRGALESARAHGVDHEVLSAAEVRDRFPALRPDDGLAAVLESRAGVLIPEDAIGAMLAQAAEHGADLRFDEPVLSWEAGRDGVRVITAGGVVEARRLILSAGGWLDQELARCPLPLQVTRQVMFWVRPAGDPALWSPQRLPVWLWETPEGPVWYGFPDLGDGPKVARHHGGAPVTPATVGRAVGADEAGPLLDFLAAQAPALHGPVTDARVCLYTNTPDEHFLIDRHPGHPAVVLASPCSGHGFKFAPTIGEMLADLVTSRPSRFDLRPFRYDRFPKP